MTRAESSRTGSARTTTGNIRTVRLNTYRERKNEVLQLELENEQLASTIDHLRQTVKNQQEQMDTMQMKLDADQAALYAAEEDKARLARRQKPKTPIITPGKPVRHTREASNVSEVSYVTNNEVVTAINFLQRLVRNNNS